MSKFNGLLNLTKNNTCIYDNFAIKGIKNTNKIIYREDDISVTIFIEDNTIKMKRTTSDYIIEMPFINNVSTIGKYYLKEEKSSIDLNLNTNIITYDESKIYIDYNLSMVDEYIGHFVFSLELEVEL